MRQLADTLQQDFRDDLNRAQTTEFSREGNTVAAMRELTGSIQRISTAFWDTVSKEAREEVQQMAEHTARVQKQMERQHAQTGDLLLQESYSLNLCKRAIAND